MTLETLEIGLDLEMEDSLSEISGPDNQSRPGGAEGRKRTIGHRVVCEAAGILADIRCGIW